MVAVVAAEAEAERAYAPMLCRAAAQPPAGPGWAAEVKWDGVRAVAYRRGGEPVRLLRRRGADGTAEFPEVAAALSALPPGVYDGELVCWDAAGRPDFHALQRRRQTGARAAYVVFDVLECGADAALWRAPYAARRRVLDALGAGRREPALVFPGAHDDPAALLETAVAAGLEGIVAKRCDSAYQPGRRSPDWVKVKVGQVREAWVCGYTVGERSREGKIGALLLAGQATDGFRYAGKAGTGLTEREADALAAALRADEAAAPTCAGVPRQRRPIVWVRPRWRARVEFAELTDAGAMRFPSVRRVWRAGRDGDARDA